MGVKARRAGGNMAGLRTRGFICCRIIKVGLNRVLATCFPVSVRVTSPPPPPPLPGAHCSGPTTDSCSGRCANIQPLGVCLRSAAPPHTHQRRVECLPVRPCFPPPPSLPRKRGVRHMGHITGQQLIPVAPLAQKPPRSDNRR